MTYQRGEKLGRSAIGSRPRYHYAGSLGSTQAPVVFCEVANRALLLIAWFLGCGRDRNFSPSWVAPFNDIVQKISATTATVTLSAPQIQATEEKALLSWRNVTDKLHQIYRSMTPATGCSRTRAPPEMRAERASPLQCNGSPQAAG